MIRKGRGQALDFPYKRLVAAIPALSVETSGRVPWKTLRPLVLDFSKARTSEAKLNALVGMRLLVEQERLSWQNDGSCK
jgi:hypothetical protein